MKKRGLVGLMTHQYKKLPVTMKMLMQFNVMPRTHYYWCNPEKSSVCLSVCILYVVCQATPMEAAGRAIEAGTAEQFQMG